MAELDRTERDIAILEEALRVARLALIDPNLSAELRSRGQSTIEMYERHLTELRTKRDDLRSLAAD
ncbi:hypothetical protein SAMN02799636_05984 [Methylobacterium sp. 275MFSha3.1]|uniref:hypothetical protein n=1 Tax=Methylobacterium sp. 275MFSha3.1 TaxID=1502746 RepID=UPI0008A7767B|nr:hypothetical protein [Methylobacterium sp. 275MFSha3.1]SEI14823.1 hypothetical protein SAMN02799636_05984 [Methylobacterium sp. 275MFSha3.1]